MRCTRGIDSAAVAAVEPPGQIAQSTVTRLVTCTDGWSLGSPSSVLRLTSSCASVMAATRTGVVPFGPI
jgi:hypothetical protein